MEQQSSQMTVQRNWPKGDCHTFRKEIIAQKWSMKADEVVVFPFEIRFSKESPSFIFNFMETMNLEELAGKIRDEFKMRAELYLNFLGHMKECFQVALEGRPMKPGAPWFKIKVKTKKSEEEIRKWLNAVQTRTDKVIDEYEIVEVPVECPGNQTYIIPMARRTNMRKVTRFLAIKMKVSRKDLTIKYKRQGAGSMDTLMTLGWKEGDKLIVSERKKFEVKPVQFVLPALEVKPVPLVEDTGSVDNNTAVNFSVSSFFNF